MGQYYLAVNILTGEHLAPHAYGNNGVKLMEHSYVNNDFVCAVKQMLMTGHDWAGARIVWAGDYGDLKFSDFSKDRKLARFADELSGSDANIYCEVPANKELSSVKPIKDPETLVLVNHTKKQFLLYSKVVSNDSWQIDPLPLLTSDGNGRGGGDYSGSFIVFVGTWAGDSIEIMAAAPAEYKEFIVDFKEDR